MMEVNPYVWYATRKLDRVPSHFTKASTPITSESEFWVKSKLTGRYATAHIHDVTLLLDSANYFIYFEDPAEAMMYELRWSGSK